MVVQSSLRFLLESNLAGATRTDESPDGRPPWSRVNSTRNGPTNASLYTGVTVTGGFVRVRKLSAVSVAVTTYVAASSSLVYVPA
jgi:hypothetical protein